MGHGWSFFFQESYCVDYDSILVFIKISGYLWYLKKDILLNLQLLWYACKLMN